MNTKGAEEKTDQSIEKFTRIYILDVRQAGCPSELCAGCRSKVKSMNAKDAKDAKDAKVRKGSQRKYQIKA
jgi:hypothetical protein